MQQMILGIDVSKNTLTIYNALTKDIQTIENTPEAIILYMKDFQEIFTKTSDWKVGIESTGDYSLLALRLFGESGFSLRFLNPVVTSKYIKGTVREKKTDDSDSVLIAKAVANGEGDEVDISVLIPEQKKVALRVERSIGSMTKSLKLVLQSVKQKQKSICTPEDELGNQKFESILSVLDTLLESCSEAKDKLLDIATEGGQQTNQEKLIDSIPGFALKLSAVVSTELGDIKRFHNSKQLRAFTGLDPKIRQSGNMNYSPGMTKHGNPTIRSALYLAAQTAYRYDPKLNEIYNIKKTQGKSHVHCVNIIASKLCERIYSVVHNNRPYVVPPSSKSNMRAVLGSNTNQKSEITT